MRVCGDFTGTIGVAAPWADSESSDPLVFIEVKDRSVATSGSSQRGFRIGGKWYSHVFDPRTGEPVERVASATVVAPGAVDADALAKACCVLEPEQSLRLIESLPDTECLIVMAGGELKKSNGWPLLESPPLVALGAADDPQAKGKPAGDVDQRKSREEGRDKKPRPAVPWNKELELLINFEINNPASGDGDEDDEGGGARTRARRPGRAIPEALRGRLGRGCRRTSRADALALGLVGWSRAVSMAARPEALVPGRSGAEAHGQERDPVHRLPARRGRPASTR